MSANVIVGAGMPCGFPLGLEGGAHATSSGAPNLPLVDPYFTDGLILLNLGAMNLSPQQTNPALYSLRSTAFHEVNEILGFDSVLNNLANDATLPAGPVSPHDLFRFEVNGHRCYSTALAEVAYFSLDGTTLLARFNQQAGGDFSDWHSPGNQTPQVQDASQSQGVAPEMGVEWRCLDAIGYSYGPRAVWVDFNYAGGTQTGEFATPFRTLAQGVSAVPVGGTVLIKGNGASLERPTCTKAMTITSVGRAVTIGQ